MRVIQEKLPTAKSVAFSRSGTSSGLRTNSIFFSCLIDFIEPHLNSFSVSRTADSIRRVGVRPQALEMGSRRQVGKVDARRLSLSLSDRPIGKGLRRRPRQRPKPHRRHSPSRMSPPTEGWRERREARNVRVKTKRKKRKRREARRRRANLVTRGERETGPEEREQRPNDGGRDGTNRPARREREKDSRFP